MTESPSDPTHARQAEPPQPPARRSTGSTLTHLEAAFNGTTHAADQLIGLDPDDGRPLLARYDLEAARATLTRDAMAGRRRGGLWRWCEVLPVRDWRWVNHMGEGSTPLLRVPRLASRLGLPDLWFKAEGQNPGGSFKARGMAVAVSRAAELGATHLVAPSAGNAGGAMAAYAARAGLRATLVMPADAPAANQLEVLLTGARLILLDGLISDCGKLARHVADRDAGFDMSTLKEPYRVEGKKTMGYEIAEDLDWQLPDVIVYPTGGGTGLVGMWKAFDEMQALGLIGAARPRMFSVQVESCAPIVRAFAAGERLATPWTGASTRAAGLRVPGAIGDFLILDALRASHGGAIAVAESALEPMQAELARLGAGYVSLETAAAVVGLEALVAAGDIAGDEQVVLFDTGAGFKSEAPSFESPAVVPNDPGAWAAL